MLVASTGLPADARNCHTTTQYQVVCSTVKQSTNHACSKTAVSAATEQSATHTLQ